MDTFISLYTAMMEAGFDSDSKGKIFEPKKLQPQAPRPVFTCTHCTDHMQRVQFISWDSRNRTGFWTLGGIFSVLLFAS